MPPGGFSFSTHSFVHHLRYYGNAKKKKKKEKSNSKQSTFFFLTWIFTKTILCARTDLNTEDESQFMALTCLRMDTCLAQPFPNITMEGSSVQGAPEFNKTRYESWFCPWPDGGTLDELFKLSSPPCPHWLHGEHLNIQSCGWNETQSADHIAQSKQSIKLLIIIPVSFLPPRKILKINLF